MANMWNSEDLGSGRQWRHRRSTLMVNTRMRAERGRDDGMTVLAIGIAAAVVVLVLAYFGLTAAGRKLFTENPAFTVRRLEVKSGDLVQADLVREYLQRMQIQEGINLFAADIVRVRREFLKNQPSAKSVQVTRVLPDRLIVQIVERVPLAAIGTARVLVADREGQVFRGAGAGRELPVLNGFGSANLAPGSRLRGMGLAALQVVESCGNVELAIDLRSIDIEAREYLVLVLGDGKTVKFAWPKMGENTAEAREALALQLSRLSKVLKTPEGQAAPRLDATYEDRIFAQGAGTAARPQSLRESRPSPAPSASRPPRRVH